MTLENSVKLEALAAVSESFRPYTPIDDLDLFAGRLDQASAVLSTIFESGRHVIIYGDRGVGKTSLTNVIDQLLDRRSGGGRLALPVVRVACDSSDRYHAVWRRVFDKLTVSISRSTTGFVGQETQQQMSFADLMPEPIRPPDVVRAAATIGRSVVIVDEFDRLEQPEVYRAFADTLKALSDDDSPMTVVIVGVGRDVTDLIGEHESVERCLRQVHMPRMSRDEIEAILDNGLHRARMSMEANAKERIVILSQGFPHYTHLLAKNASQRALARDSLAVEEDDVEGAIQSALQEAAESIKELYRRAVTPQRRTSLFEDVLLACALASEANGGTFSAVDIRAPLERVTGVSRAQPQYSYNLGKLCANERGPALERLDYPGRPRYRFRNPLLEPYVLLQGHVRGAI